MISWGTCKECGGNIIPVFNTWESDVKIIKGIDVLRCTGCLKDYPAPPDYDEGVDIKQNLGGQNGRH